MANETVMDDPLPKRALSHSLQLLPTLGLLTAIMIITGNMIGSGVFKKAAPMAAELGSPGLLLICWVIAGAISLMGALTYAEIAGLIASPGGQYSYFKTMYGRGFAFLYGWSGFIVIQSASIASIAYVFGHSANALIEFPRLSANWESLSVFGLFQPFDNIGVKAFTVATLVLVTAVNVAGVAYGGFVANCSSVIKFAGLALIIILGFAWTGGSSSNLTPVLAAPGMQYSSSFGLFGAMFGAMLGAFWAYDGWVNITFLGGEIKNPKRNIPLALGLGVGAVVLIYTLIHIAYLYVMPVDEMAALAANENAIVGVEVMRKAFGGWAAGVVALLILLSTFGATNCQLLPPSRMYFAMARDGLFFRNAAACHTRFRTPHISLMMQCAWTCVLVITGTFDQLTNMVVFASFIFYGATALGLFVLRRKLPDAPRPYRVTGYPVLPAVYLIFCATLVVVTINDQPIDALKGLVLMASGLPFYLLWRKSAQVQECDNP